MLIIVLLQVNHSQRLNDPQLKPWVLVADDGVVKGAHCNCVAGLGSACSHMAALLFHVLEINDSKCDMSVTSKRCKWSEPSQQSIKKVECQEGRHIIFNNTQRAKKTELHSSSTSSVTSASSSTTTSFSTKPSDSLLSHDDIQEFYNALSQCKKQNGQPIKPAILSLVKAHSHNYIPKEIQLDMPIPLTELYHKDNRSLSKEALLKKAEEVFDDLKITKEQVS